MAGLPQTDCLCRHKVTILHFSSSTSLPFPVQILSLKGSFLHQGRVRNGGFRLHGFVISTVIRYDCRQTSHLVILYCLLPVMMSLMYPLVWSARNSIKHYSECVCIDVRSTVESVKQSGPPNVGRLHIIIWNRSWEKIKKGRIHSPCQLSSRWDIDLPSSDLD